jgi:hypothetical protein
MYCSTVLYMYPAHSTPGTCMCTVPGYTSHEVTLGHVLHILHRFTLYPGTVRYTPKFMNVCVCTHTAPTTPRAPMDCPIHFPHHSIVEFVDLFSPLVSTPPPIETPSILNHHHHHHHAHPHLLCNWWFLSNLGSISRKTN